MALYWSFQIEMLFRSEIAEKLCHEPPRRRRFSQLIYVDENVRHRGVFCAFRLGSVSLLRSLESQMVILGWGVTDDLNSDSACKHVIRHVIRKWHETGSDCSCFHQNVSPTQAWSLSDERQCWTNSCTWVKLVNLSFGIHVCVYT